MAMDIVTKAQKLLPQAVYEMLGHAEKMKRTAPTLEERQYWQGRADAIRVCSILFADVLKKDASLDALGVKTSKSAHIPEDDLEIAENYKLFGTPSPPAPEVEL